MAYVPKQIPGSQANLFGRDEETTAFPLPPQTGGSSGTTPAGGGSTSNAAPGIGTSTQFGSNAAKLSDYLAANKEQIGAFGQEVAGNLTKGYNDTLGAIDQGYGDFTNQVNQGFNKPNQQKIDSALANPTQFVQNPDDVNQFRSYYNNQYQGPDNFQSSGNYGDLNSKVNKSVENANLVDSFSGLSTFLNNVTGGQDTTGGMRTLNTALLMRNPDAWNTIKTAAAPAKGLTDYLGTKANAANDAASQAKQQTDQSRTDIQNKINGPQGLIPQLGDRMKTATEQALQNRNAYNLSRTELQQRLPGLQNLFKRGELPPGVIGTADMSPIDVFDPSVAPLTDAPTQSNVASPEDYSYEAALEQLTGQDLNILNNADKGQAGTFKIPGDVPNKQNELNKIIMENRYGLSSKLNQEMSSLGLPRQSGMTGGQMLDALKGQNVSQQTKSMLDQLVNLGVLSPQDGWYSGRTY